jgi:adenine-specific DNA-methyltransferase
MKVFIGGSRRISRLDADVRRRIDRIIEKRLHVIVGDANGADKAVQEYLRSKRYDLVEVFCSGDACRNNQGGWATRAISVPQSGKRKDFAFYATKDRAMAEEATVGLMLWDRESVGTLMNVLRLIRNHKKVVVYVAPDHEFVEVKTETDWEQFLSRCADELRARIAKESLDEQVGERAPAQASLL